MLKNQKGLTLLELIVALSLVSFIIVVGSQIFFTHSTTFSFVGQKSKLASTASIIQERLLEIGTQSAGISQISINDFDSLNQKNENLDNVQILSFQTDSGELSFTYNEALQTLKLNETILGTEVTEFIVMPIPEHKTFKEANGIKVRLQLTIPSGRKSVTHETSSIIAFRNKEAE